MSQAPIQNWDCLVFSMSSPAVDSYRGLKEIPWHVLHGKEQGKLSVCVCFEHLEQQVQNKRNHLRLQEHWLQEASVHPFLFPCLVPSIPSSQRSAALPLWEPFSWPVLRSRRALESADSLSVSFHTSLLFVAEFQHL